jgi:hypothetical protein
VLTALTAAGDPLLPGREIARPKTEIFDTFLGYFVGVVLSDALGYADAEYLHRLMPEFDAFLSLSFEDIRRVGRSRASDGTRITVDFRGPIVLPIPFKILWDTPGSIHAADTVTARETRIALLEGPEPLSPVYVYDIEAGELWIDFDPWIDVLLGRAVDDVVIRRALLFRMSGKWYAALMGSGYEGQLVAGYFELASNRIVVPVPRRLRFVSETLGQTQ